MTIRSEVIQAYSTVYETEKGIAKTVLNEILSFQSKLEHILNEMEPDTQRSVVASLIVSILAGINTASPNRNKLKVLYGIEENKS